MSDLNNEAQILWDLGTAYDFLASLTVLHHPAKFGLRGAWAAGVRSRLGQKERDFLEGLYENMPLRYAWVRSLPEPRDGETLLYHLKKIPAKERLLELYSVPGFNSPIDARLQAVVEQGAWTPEDRDFIIEELKGSGEKISPRYVDRMLDYFANAEENGEKLLTALQLYYEVFFAEEEKRILPKLNIALDDAKKLAEKLSDIDLLEQLSHGLRYESLPTSKTLVIVPSYWLSPLVTWERLTEDESIYLFGSRPSGESLVPGEIVPEDLLAALKALADPTRLRILRYLMQEQLTPAELSRRLRLRAPTVTHHLHSLRLAGLVRFMIKGKHERLYSARIESIQQGYTLLKEFLEKDAQEEEQQPPIDRSRAM